MKWKVAQLNAIGAMGSDNRDAFYERLWHDLRRNRYDADLMDIEYSVKESQYALHHHEWTKPERVHTPLAMEPGTSEFDTLGRRGELGHGQVPRTPGVPGIHECPRCALSRGRAPPRIQVPSLLRARKDARDHHQADAVGRPKAGRLLQAPSIR